MNFKSICTCQNCDQLYCAECSAAPHRWEFCSDECERNILREHINDEPMVGEMQPEKIIYRTWHWDWPWDLTSLSAWFDCKWACHGTGKYGWRFFGIVCEYHWTWKLPIRETNTPNAPKYENKIPFDNGEE